MAKYIAIPRRTVVAMDDHWETETRISAIHRNEDTKIEPTGLGGWTYALRLLLLLLRGRPPACRRRCGSLRHRRFSAVSWRSRQPRRTERQMRVREVRSLRTNATRRMLGTRSLQKRPASFRDGKDARQKENRGIAASVGPVFQKGLFVEVQRIKGRSETTCSVQHCSALGQVPISAAGNCRCSNCRRIHCFLLFPLLPLLIMSASSTTSAMSVMRY